MDKVIREFNNFRSGQLPKAQTLVKQTEAYSTGCEEMTSAMINPSGYIEAKPGYTDSRPFKYPYSTINGKKYILNSEITNDTVLPTESFITGIQDGDKAITDAFTTGIHLSKVVIGDTMIDNDGTKFNKFKTGHADKVIAKMDGSTGSNVSSSLLVVGKKYRISAVGTTDFVACGASYSILGYTFICVATASGSGTAIECTAANDNRLFCTGMYYSFANAISFFRGFDKYHSTDSHTHLKHANDLNGTSVDYYQNSGLHLMHDTYDSFVAGWGMQSDAVSSSRTSGDTALIFQLGWTFENTNTTKTRSLRGGISFSGESESKYETRKGRVSNSTNISQVRYSIPSGVHLFNSDVWVAGMSEMFEDSQQDMFEQYELIDASGNFNISSGANGKSSYEKGVPVLAWGNFESTDSTKLADRTKISTTGTPASANSFVFTGKTFTSGARRIGYANFKGENGIAATELYTGGGGAPLTPGVAEVEDGRVIPSSGTTSADAYHISIGSEILWMQRTNRGILLGAKDGEYLLQNEQVNPPTLTKVSSIGGSQPESFIRSVSCEMDGRVYFASQYGLSSIQFSNEAQSYIPQHIYTEQYGGSVIGVGQVPGERALVVLLSNKTIWRIFAETGGLSFIQTVSDADGLTSDGGIIRGSQDFLMLGTSGGTATIQTTKFGKFPSGTVNLKKIYVSMVDTVPTEEFVYSVDGMPDVAIFDPGEVAQYAVDGVLFSGSRELFTGGIKDLSDGGLSVRLTVPADTKIIGVFADTVVTGV